MDPLSILGAALGVTSLTIQIAEECIKGFKLYNEAANLPKTYKYLQVRFHLEQQRFLNFVLEAGILYTDGIICSSLQVNRSLLLAVLAEIKTLLEQYAAKNGKYVALVAQDHVDLDDVEEPGSELLDFLCLPAKPGINPDDDGTESKKSKSAKYLRNFGKNIVQTGKTLRTIATEPKRLVWAAMDKDSFEEMISRLGHFNSFLIALLDSSQIRKLQGVMDTAYLEILQLRNDVVSLTTLVEALTPSVITRQDSSQDTSSVEVDPFSQAVAEEKTTQEKKRTYLKELAEIKIRFTMLSQSDSTLSVVSGSGDSSSFLPLANFAFSEDIWEDDVMLRTSTTYEGTNVWIEWKDVSMVTSSSPFVDLIESRTILLTNLLRLVKPEGFRAPACLGYTKVLDDDQIIRLGIVFEKPSTISVNAELTTLRELLGSQPKPSLSTRMSLCAVLARCIHSFHAVNWLHKALRPENIIYYSNRPDLTAPFVAGFELSRPSIMDEMTEKPGFDPSQDIYRHPSAQSSRTDGNYRKSYDIYSLGILLIEIALWTPVEDVVGFKNLLKTKPTIIQGMQSYLLGEAVPPNHTKPAIQCLPQVASACGDTVQKVIDLCLRADKTEDPEYPGESETSIALRLQGTMEEDVVKRLEHISRIL